MQWLKLPTALARSPALLTVSLAARGLFFQLFIAANEAGRIDVPNGTTHEEVASALAHDPTSAASPVAALDELTARGLVICASGLLVVPLRLGTDTAGVAAGGTGSRGGKSDADRARAYRQRRTVTTGVTTGVTESVTAPSRATVTESHVTNCDASRTVTGTVTGSASVNQAENKALEATVTAGVTDRHGAREEEREENRETEKEKSARVTAEPVTPPAPPPTSLVLSSPSTTAKPKRAKIPPLPDPVPMGGVARQVYDAIVSDPALVLVVEGPGDFANRITAEGAYPGVNVLAEVRRAGEWLSRNPSRWNGSGRAGMVNWLRRTAEEAAAKPKPVGAVAGRPGPTRGPLPPAPASAFPDVDPVETARSIEADRAAIDAARAANRGVRAIGGVR